MVTADQHIARTRVPGTHDVSHAPRHMGGEGGPATGQATNDDGGEGQHVPPHDGEAAELPKGGGAVGAAEVPARAAVRRRRGRKRPKLVTFWVTEAELASIRDLARAAGTSVSRYCLDSTVYADTLADLPSRSQLASLIVELRREGNNLNQIARSLNASDVPADADEHVAATEAMERLRTLWADVEGSLRTTVVRLAGVLPD